MSQEKKKARQSLQAGRANAYQHTDSIRKAVVALAAAAVAYSMAPFACEAYQLGEAARAAVCEVSFAVPLMAALCFLWEALWSMAGGFDGGR